MLTIFNLLEQPSDKWQEGECQLCKCTEEGTKKCSEHCFLDCEPGYEVVNDNADDGVCCSCQPIGKCKLQDSSFVPVSCHNFSQKNVSLNVFLNKTFAGQLNLERGRVHQMQMHGPADGHMQRHQVSALSAGIRCQASDRYVLRHLRPGLHDNHQNELDTFK